MNSRMVAEPHLRRCLSVVASCFVLLLGSGTRAQAQNAGLVLLRTFGARAAGLGEAVTADTALGAEGMWWNPSALAHITSSEVGLHNFKDFLNASNMLTAIVPSKVIGTVGAFAYAWDYGDQLSTDPNTGATTGTITIRSYLFGASYATPIGKRLSVGLTYKLILDRYTCSGACGGIVLSGSTTALDVGAQYVAPVTFPLAFGLSVRNIGPGLKIKDAPQADPLSKTVQFGATGRLPIQALADAKTSVELSADVFQSEAFGGAGYGMGAAVGFQDEYFLRAGYNYKPGGIGSAPSLGLGVNFGAFSIDFSRQFDQTSQGTGTAPTFLSLRARF